MPKRILTIFRKDADPIRFEDAGDIELGFGPGVLVVNQRLSSAQNAARISRYILPLERLYEVMLEDT